MTSTSHVSAVSNRLCWALALAGSAVLIVAGSALAQAPKAEVPPAADGARIGEKHGQSAASEHELRKKAREILSKRLEMRKRETEALERALQLFDQGKTLEELRTLLPDLPRFGQRGEEREQWQRRMEQWGAGPQPGGEDVNRLGSPGGMPQANGPANGGPSGIGPSGKPQETPHPLTEEERATVREVLAATAPETLARLRELEKAEPAKAEQQYARSLERMRFLIDLRKRDPQMFELKAKDIRHSFEAGALVRAIGDIDKSATPDTAVRQQKVELLRAALLAQYNVRTQIMQRDIERSADRAADLAKEVEKRPAQAADVVDKNVREMIDREHRRRERQGGENGRGGDRHGGGPDGKPDGKPGEPPPRQ